MRLLENVVATGLVMARDVKGKHGKFLKTAYMSLLAGVLAITGFGTAFAVGGADTQKITDTVKLVLGIVYVIMVIVGVFLFVTNIMAYATADADNGPARTKATYGIAGGGILILLPAVLTVFPFAEWVTKQVTDLIGGNSRQG